MYERFTDRAKKVMALANQEAGRFNHDYLGSQHILLGLVKERQGIPGTILHVWGINLKNLLEQVGKITPARPESDRAIRQLDPTGKEAVEFAIEEARALTHNYVGTEHLMLGLIRQENSAAIQALRNLGVDPDRLREAILGAVHSTRG